MNTVLASGCSSDPPESGVGRQEMDWEQKKRKREAISGRRGRARAVARAVERGVGRAPVVGTFNAAVTQMDCDLLDPGEDRMWM